MPRSQLNIFITLRLKLLFRHVREVGIARIIILLPLLLAFISQSVVFVSNYHPSFLLAFYLLIAVTIHIVRDNYLIVSHLNVETRVVYGAEYNLAVLPLSLFVSFAGAFWAIPTGHGMATLVAFLPDYSPEYPLKNGRIYNWIPQRVFEWRTTFRRYNRWILLSYMMGLLLSFYTCTLPVFIFYWSTFVAYTFNHAEPRELMEEYSPKLPFLRQKIKKHSLFLHALLTPHYLLFLLFHFHSWYILVAAVLFIQAITMFCIFFKYARLAHTRLAVRNQIPVAVFLLLTIILPPVSLIVLFNYWRKAHAATHA